MTEIIIHFFRFLYRNLPYLGYVVWLDALGWLLYSENYKAYLQPGLYPFLITGAIVMLLFLAALIFAPAPMTVKPLNSLIMLIPAVFLYASYGKSLGTHAFSKKAPSANIVSSLSSGSISFESEMSLADIAMNAEKFRGKRVSAEGLVFRTEDVPKGCGIFFRYVIACCAADAVPVWVLLKKEDFGFSEEEIWVKASGILHFEKVDGKELPVIHADEIATMPMPSPSSQYIFLRMKLR